MSNEEIVSTLIGVYRVIMLLYWWCVWIFGTLA